MESMFPAIACLLLTILIIQQCFLQYYLYKQGVEREAVDARKGASKISYSEGTQTTTAVYCSQGTQKNDAQEEISNVYCSQETQTAKATYTNQGMQTAEIEKVTPKEHLSQETQTADIQDGTSIAYCSQGTQTADAGEETPTPCSSQEIQTADTSKATLTPCSSQETQTSDEPQENEKTDTPPLISNAWVLFQALPDGTERRIPLKQHRRPRPPGILPWNREAGTLEAKKAWSKSLAQPARPVPKLVLRINDRLKSQMDGCLKSLDNGPKDDTSEDVETKSEEPENPKKVIPSTTSECTLHRLYPELRIQIYKLAMIIDAKTKAGPPLLAALRGDKKLYAEALDVYYSVNTFKMTGNNFRSFYYDDCISSKLQESIVHLEVDLRYTRADSRIPFGTFGPFNKGEGGYEPQDYGGVMLAFAEFRNTSAGGNLKTLKVQIERWALQNWYIDLLRLLCYFDTLREITIEVNNNRYVKRTVKEEAEDFEGTIHGVNYDLVSQFNEEKKSASLLRIKPLEDSKTEFRWIVFGKQCEGRNGVLRYKLIHGETSTVA